MFHFLQTKLFSHLIAQFFCSLTKVWADKNGVRRAIAFPQVFHSKVANIAHAIGHIGHVEHAEVALANLIIASCPKNAHYRDIPANLIKYCIFLSHVHQTD